MTNSLLLLLMKNKINNKIIYYIGLVILVILGIQIYWNYKNYLASKQQLINEVQTSLDNAVDEYYALSAKRKSQFILRTRPMTMISEPKKKSQAGGIPKKLLVKTDTLVVYDHVSQVKETVGLEMGRTHMGTAVEFSPSMDSLVRQVVFSLKKDTIDLNILKDYITKELERKNIDMNFGLHLHDKEDTDQRLNSAVFKKSSLSTSSKSSWLPQNTSLTLYFTNTTENLLKKNIVGIFLSTILIGSVIACLLYLLKIIQEQKQLDDLKNDLINNITHEFKTPISTIRVAMEGILNFNEEKKVEKALSYAKISSVQVEKLDNMVEKLLETAAITEGKLDLNKEEISLVPLLKNLLEKYKTSNIDSQKLFELIIKNDPIVVMADPFHLENAFSNLLDNAVKYGGQYITVALDDKKDYAEIIFSDSGKSLTKIQANQVFEKFYRVPRGNTHDVKGYGIGLYYTRQIIESHGGSIQVNVSENTKFTVRLTYG